MFYSLADGFVYTCHLGLCGRDNFYYASFTSEDSGLCMVGIGKLVLKWFRVCDMTVYVEMRSAPYLLITPRE